MCVCVLLVACRNYSRLVVGCLFTDPLLLLLLLPLRTVQIRIPNLRVFNNSRLRSDNGSLRTYPRRGFASPPSPHFHCATPNACMASPPASRQRSTPLPPPFTKRRPTHVCTHYTRAWQTRTHAISLALLKCTDVGTSSEPPFCLPRVDSHN